MSRCKAMLQANYSRLVRAGQRCPESVLPGRDLCWVHTHAAQDGVAVQRFPLKDAAATVRR